MFRPISHCGHECDQPFYLNGPNLQENPPIFNVPSTVFGLIGLFVGVHLFRQYISGPADWEFLLTFAFIPQRYAALAAGHSGMFPGGNMADIWTFFSYMFLHGDWSHLALNSLWMLAFGTPLAVRLGSVRFVVFSLILAASGAAMHLAIYWGELVPVVGASAAISGHMAAVVRFSMSGPSYMPIGTAASQQNFTPAEPLSRVLQNPRILMFIAVWFGINLIFGVGIVDITGTGAQIAWEAHLGGFLAGLLLFPFFDPVRRTG